MKTDDKNQIGNKKMNYFSLFSGVGGFEYGIQQAHRSRNLREPKNTIRSGKTNIQSQGNIPNPLCSDGDGGRIRPSCVGFSEIDKYAIQIYKKHFPTHKEYGDVSKINWNNVEDFDLLCGGFPCQSFSIAGKRGGFNDIRGTLFFEIARAAQEKQPRLLFLENVKGLLSHDKGRTFGTILNTLDELGYDLQWQVLNSKNFGVPQNRERVFIVGHLRGTSRPQVFPITKQTTENVQSCSKEQKGKSWVSTLDSRYGQRWSTETYVRTDYSNPQPQGDKSDSSNCIRRATYSDDMRIRRLTPTECEFLQSFPKNWTKYGVINYGHATKENALEILQILWEKISENSGEGRGFTESITLLKKEILRQNLHEIELQREMEADGIATTRKLSCQTIGICEILCEMWEKEKSRYSPQRQEQIEQLLEKLTSVVPKLPYEITQERGWVEYRVCQEPKKGQEGKIYSFCGISDTQRYKCLGNAVTVNVISAIAKKLLGPSAEYDKIAL